MQTHWNVVAELWLSFAVALAGFCGLVLLANGQPERERGGDSAIAITSLAYFSLAAYENWLWGWQFSWFLADTLFIWAVVVAARITNRPIQIAIAAILCFAATFSVAYGVVSWIALLPLLWRPPKRLAVVAVWVALFGASMTLYLHRFNATAIHVRGSIPAEIAYTLGIAGAPLTRVAIIAVCLGAVLFACFALLAWRDRQAPWISIGLFALGFALLNAIGRSGLGLSQALSSRYLTPGSLLLIAVVNLGMPRFRWRSAVLGGIALALIAQAATSIPLGWQIKQSRDESRVCLALILVNASIDCPPGLYPNGETLRRDAAAMNQLGIRPLVTPGDFVLAPQARGSIDSVRPESRTPHPAVIATGRVDLPSRGVFAVVATQPGQRRIIAANLVRGPGTARWSLMFPPALEERNREFEVWLFVPAERKIRLMAGYSGTPLVKKLGIRPGSTILIDGEPTEYPTHEASVVHALSDRVDMVHLFTKRAGELRAKLHKYRRAIRDDAVVWISWPKRASKVPTDITEDVIRAIALPLGFVDIKVCAVDDVWSGLKLVIRREERR